MDRGDAMDEVIEQQVKLAPGELRALSMREDGASLRHAAGSLGLLALGLAAAVVAPGPLTWTAGGLMMGGMFPPFHEALHRTVFRSRAANDLFAAVTGFFQVASPAQYRAFHMTHHRHTHAVGDPEIAFFPEQLAAWPGNPVVGLVMASGQPILFAKVMWLVSCSLLPGAWWGRLLPWVPEDERWRVKVESLLIAAGHAGVLWLWGPLAWTWLVMLMIGHLGMGPFLLCEHTGLAMAGSTVARTRSLRAPRIISWFAWNMNLHAEHHGWPSVPWWRLTDLSDTLGDRLPHRATYPQVWGEAVRAWLGRGG